MNLFLGFVNTILVQEKWAQREEQFPPLFVLNLELVFCDDKLIFNTWKVEKSNSAQKQLVRNFLGIVKRPSDYHPNWLFMMVHKMAQKGKQVMGWEKDKWSVLNQSEMFPITTRLHAVWTVPSHTNSFQQTRFPTALFKRSIESFRSEDCEIFLHSYKLEALKDIEICWNNLIDFHRFQISNRIFSNYSEIDINSEPEHSL